VERCPRLLSDWFPPTGKVFGPELYAAAQKPEGQISEVGYMFGAIQSVAPSFGVELKPVNIRDTAEIERAIVTLAASGNGGIIVTGSPFAPLHCELIVALAARHKVPSIFFERFFATNGGLMS
jgi:hypothetical protein